MADVASKIWLPVSAVIPTGNRAAMLQRTLLSLLDQSHLPSQVIIIDSSADQSTVYTIGSMPAAYLSRFTYLKAVEKGAAAQRNTGIEEASESTIFFLDDDLLFEPGCVEKMWKGFEFVPNVGAVSAMIINQHYTPPGALTRFMYRLLSGEAKESYAGKLIGPAWNLLPEDRDALPEYVQCDWLNTTCTMYRRDALPDPVFDPFFKGYSLMEDVALSVTVGKSRKLLNARTARIYHDSQPGDHKNSVSELSSMELVNRHFVMTHVMRRTSAGDYLKLAIFEMFSILSCFRTTQTIRQIPSITWGKIKAIQKLVR